MMELSSEGWTKLSGYFGGYTNTDLHSFYVKAEDHTEATVHVLVNEAGTC